MTLLLLMTKLLGIYKNYFFCYTFFLFHETLMSLNLIAQYTLTHIFFALSMFLKKFIYITTILSNKIVNTFLLLVALLQLHTRF